MQGEHDPHHRDDPTGKDAGNRSIQTDRDEDDQHDGEIREAVDVQRINKMVDVKNALADVENFKDEGEERNAGEHHVWEIAHERDEKELNVGAVFAEFFFRSFLEPFPG